MNTLLIPNNGGVWKVRWMALCAMVSSPNEGCIGYCCGRRGLARYSGRLSSTTGVSRPRSQLRDLGMVESLGICRQHFQRRFSSEAVVGLIQLLGNCLIRDEK